MKVCIDPGHGMSNKQWGIYDPGAVHVENGFKFQEADIALRYALGVKDALRARQVDVFMTRDDATDHAPVGGRAAGAKKAGCELFLSIHLNDVESDLANGLEVLYRDTEDKVLAERLLAALLPITGIRTRGVKKRTDLAVLKFDGPVALIELGFIGNDHDRGRLLDPQVRDSACRAIAETIIAYLKKP